MAKKTIIGYIVGADPTMYDATSIRTDIDEDDVVDINVLLEDTIQQIVSETGCDLGEIEIFPIYLEDKLVIKTIVVPAPGGDND